MRLKNEDRRFFVRMGHKMVTGIVMVQLALFLVFTGIFSVNAQENGVLNFKDAVLSEALNKISRELNCKFVFNYDDLKGYKVTADLKGKKVEECLDILLAGKPFRYEHQGDVYVISSQGNRQVNQPVVVKGTVKDEAGLPLPGVVVIVKGTVPGCATDVDGNFELKVPGTDAILVFSFVGMKTVELPADAANAMMVTMKEEAAMLQEVVATGYQTISRERSTGSASIVKAETLDKMQATDLSSKLEGLVPGLSTYNGDLVVRGRGSFTRYYQPIVVIDGQVTSQSLSDINPKDIESVTVLKDAAAASLYGVRASNGVIVVTTKRAKKGTNVNVSAEFYINPVPDMDYMHYASTADIIKLERDILENDINYTSDPLGYFQDKADFTSNRFGALSGVEKVYYRLAKNEITEEEAEKIFEEMSKNDYRKEAQKALNQTMFTQDYTLSLTKGGENSNLLLSLRYQNYGSYNKSDDAHRFSMYFKNDMDLSDWMKLTYGMQANFYRTAASQSGANWGDAMPYERLKDEDGNPVYQYFYNEEWAKELEETDGVKSLGYNALEESTKNMAVTNNTYLKLFTHADFKIIEGLDLGLKFQYEKKFSDTKQFDEEDSYKMRVLINKFAQKNQYNTLDYYLPEGGHMSLVQGRKEFYNFRAQLNYHKMFGDKHDLTALLGGEIRQDWSKSSTEERYGYDEKKLTYQQVDWATLAKGITGLLSSTSQTLSENLSISDVKHRYVSAYANVGYTYDDRYMANASVRMEQADLFGTDPKYRYRPLWSLGVSWNIYRESFMANAEWMDMLKLRVTYGITGNVDQSSTPYLIGFVANWQGYDYTTINTPPNPKLRWEKTSTWNFGVDFSFFRKLSGSFDVYRKYSSDLLANWTLDPSTGFNSSRVNNGEMRNVGLELTLNYDWLKKGDWEFTTSFTTAYNKNEVMKVDFVPTTATDMLTSPSSNYLKGDALKSVYAYRYAGLTEEGNPSVYNENGEVVSGVIVDNINALVNKGQLTPKWNGALSLNLRWKELELYTKFVYYAGHSLRNDVTGLYNTLSDVDAYVHEDVVKRWTPENTDTDVPAMCKGSIAPGAANQWKYADIHVLSASFIKCRTIGLSYRLPEEWIKSLKLKSVSLRAQVENPFYWANNHEDIDPEAFTANTGTRTEAQMPTYTFGLNINF